MPIQNKTRVFRVTEEHVAILKNLSIHTAMFIPDRDVMAVRGPFEICPDIDKKRLFGNSGPYDECTLEELGYEFEDPEECTYAEKDLYHARMLLAQVPLAYAAVMANGAVEPCEVSLPEGRAWYQYRAHRAVIFWRAAISEAVGEGVCPDMLVELIANVKNDAPMDVLRHIEPMTGNAEWIGTALSVLKRHAVRLFLSENPDKAGGPENAVAEKLMSGEYGLSYGDGYDGRSGAET